MRAPKAHRAPRQHVSQPILRRKRMVVGVSVASKNRAAPAGAKHNNDGLNPSPECGWLRPDSCASQRRPAVGRAVEQRDDERAGRSLSAVRGA